jgi:hypothetical protein
MTAKLFTGNRVKVVDRKNTMYYQVLLHTLNHTIDVMSKRRKKLKKEYVVGYSEFCAACVKCRANAQEMRELDHSVTVTLDCYSCTRRQQEYDRCKTHADKMFSVDRVLRMYRHMRTETRTDVACLGSKSRRKRDEKG